MTKLEEVSALIEKLAQEATIETLNKSNKVYTEVQEEYNRDIAGFVFECRRFGQFLTLSLARKVNAPNYEEEYSISVNIKNITHIQLIEGHKPDFNGIVQYEYVVDTKDRGKYWENYVSESMYDFILSSEWEINIQEQYHSIPYRYLFVVDSSKKHTDSHLQSYSGEYWEIKTNVPHYPRGAEDDQIVFTGINSTLFVPAGKGAEVLQQILDATA